MSTQEIDRAIATLDITTLKEVLKTLGVLSDGDKASLRQRYQDCVLNIGLKGFLQKLKPKDVVDIGEVLSLSEKKSHEEFQQALEAAALKEGIVRIIEASNEDLLHRYCGILGLDTAVTSVEDMKKQIADEVMLTGMESLLNKLSSSLLRSHAKEIGIDSTGSNKELVDR